jgi:hypothetical protein
LNPSLAFPPVPAAATITVCDVYYLRGTLVNVGQDGNQQAAELIAPAADVPKVASAKLSSDTEIARFYSNPPLTDAWQVSEDITGLLWLSTNRPNTTFNIKLLDYNPVNGNVILLGELLLTLLSAGADTFSFNITPPAAPIAAGHRLLFILEGKKSSPSPDVELRYDSVNTSSQFKVCRLIQSGPSNATLYLPIISANKSGPTTLLYIESSNTGGIDPVKVLNASTNQELLRCATGNNTTQLCGKFPTPANSTYKVSASTKNCGLLQGTFSDAKPGGTVTRRIFCN